MSFDISQAADSIIKARITAKLQTEEARGNREVAMAMVSADFKKRTSDIVRGWRERVADLEAEPDGAIKNAAAIRYLKKCIEEHSPGKSAPAETGEPDNGSHPPRIAVT